VTHRPAPQVPQGAPWTSHDGSVVDDVELEVEVELELVDELELELVDVEELDVELELLDDVVTVVVVVGSGQYPSLVGLLIRNIFASFFTMSAPGPRSTWYRSPPAISSIMQKLAPGLGLFGVQLPFYVLLMRSGEVVGRFPRTPSRVPTWHSSGR
jgi:hypothetical protein